MVNYIKHLGDIMKRAGAEYNEYNRDLLDKIIREVIDMPRNDSEEVWQKVKSIMFTGDPEKKKNFEDAVVKIFVKRLITG